MKIKNIPGNKIKKEILEFLDSEDGAFYGNLVMELDEDTLTILEHLIELKKMGLVYKDHRGGKFRINDDFNIKRMPSKKSRREDKEGEWEVVEEINQFSKATRKRTKKADNNTSLNKPTPGEQKVRPGDEE